ncbi:MAG: flavodoxin [Bacteroides sp.]|nr:flavodoxin [Bacteroides sp.]
MKKLWLIYSMSLLTLTATACDSDSPEREETGRQQSETEQNNNNNNSDTTSMNIKITVGNSTITATMEDNTAARDFISRLPLEVTLNDFNNAEKIFYPSPTLTIGDTPRGCAPQAGDITIYAPWNNVAIFYKSWSHSNSLIKIGSIDGEGIEVLRVSGDVKVKFEKQ